MSWNERSRVVGIDDGPFPRRLRARVPVVGVLMSGGRRVEGVMSTWVVRDGWGATSKIGEMLTRGRLAGQAQAVLLDGIAVGGLNIIDLPRLAELVGVPVVAVMRQLPDLERFFEAIEHTTRPQRRRALVRKAGPIRQAGSVWLQVAGCSEAEARQIVEIASPFGSYPEALRVAHLVGRGMTWGSSRGGA